KLAVGDLPRATRVLPLNSGRLPALLEKTRIVDEPCMHALPRRKHVDDVPGGLPPHGSILPRALSNEVEKPVMCPARRLRLHAGACRDRLDALPLPVAKDPERVRRERLSLSRDGQMRAEPREVIRDAADTRVVHRIAHGCTMHSIDAHGNPRSGPPRRT